MIFRKITKIVKLASKYVSDAYMVYQFPKDSGYARFKGVFETFEQAIKSAPQNKAIGYNDAKLAQEYYKDAGQIEAVRDYDYPMLFWLQSIFNATTNNVSIVDFGGNVGTHYYAYEKYIRYPEGLKWTVLDVPEIIRFAKELAKTRPSAQLELTDKNDCIEDKDIFMASGSIQYVKELASMLKPILKKPRSLLINRIALYEGEQFVTLQNGGKTFYPQYVFNRLSFIDSLEKIGYELIDIWEDRIDQCIIPFHPEKSMHYYYGLYLKLRLYSE